MSRPSAEITSPVSPSNVARAFPISGTAAPGCTNVTVSVTSSSGTTNYDAPVTDGGFEVYVTAGPGDATVSAYCTASGAGTASTVEVTVS